MVLYFTSSGTYFAFDKYGTVVDPPITLFMGNDKYENEDLIKWGWVEDVWFHVDKVSSAHVYLRLNPYLAESLEVLVMALRRCTRGAKPLGLEVSWLKTKVQVFGDLLDEAVQSVHACGEDIEILESFTYLGSAVHNDGGSRQEALRRIGIAYGVRKIRLEKRINEIINRLNKTKVESQPNLRQDREERDKLERNEAKKEIKERQHKEKEEVEKRKKEQELKNYTSLFSAASMKTNKAAADEDSDDFM
ncbi:Coiled-coil domain-containing protein 25 [Chionoecetes opilio]|uniref:Coiled-coil domain-containing protein 25 n=1 Tax=Chionoecetes opilio TaxID=41210 RepID=A0A8J4XUQ6_CHIOP|nr:Coiled-coil domain-containing protein 25 [Chionoecetes opilio]